MVIPVPVVLKKENVKTLDPNVFQRIDQLSAPRLVPVLGQDPCAPVMEYDKMAAPGGLGWLARSRGGGGPAGLGVRIEAQFEVGEYQILVLSAQESTGLEKWLHLNKYKIPNGAAAALAPYVRDQQKFFVAKVDIKKVKRDSHGCVVLSPLRFDYDSAELRLPVRLGLLNADGQQDPSSTSCIPTSASSWPTIRTSLSPTNIEVANSVRDQFPRSTPRCSTRRSSAPGAAPWSPSTPGRRLRAILSDAAAQRQRHLHPR